MEAYLCRPLMEFETFTLPNGIRVIHSQTDRPVGHCGLVINAGSRDELESEAGLAHFIEHVIFKGTRKRKTFHILSRLDSVGGEINAFTSKEETWIYGSFMGHHYERAIELISDICFNSTFPEKELQKEKEVIVDEIHSYQDSPGEMIFDEFEEMLFHGHPLGRNILGTEESVNSFTREDVYRFMQRQYTADRMVFSSVSNHSVAQVRKWAEKYLCQGDLGTGSNARLPFKANGQKHVSAPKSQAQYHYVLGGLGYANEDPRKTGLIVLNNYLGGPAMNSRLNLEVREKHGVTYNIESHYSSFSDTGLVEIYLGTDKRNFAKSRRLVLKELKRLREKRLGPTQLHNAQQQLIGQIALAQESGSGIMMALGKSLLTYDRVDGLDLVYRKIQEVTAKELQDIANEIFNEDLLSSLTYINE